MILDEKRLFDECLKARKNSYSPYSKFAVGAVAVLKDGNFIHGTNVENAAYPSGLCAERTALFYASSRRPDLPIISLAIAAAQNGKLCDIPATPCGACRQVMAQYQTKGGRPMSVLLVGGKKIWKFASVDDLLPLTFNSI